MPVRIKPVRNLGPCTLNLEGIKGICALMDKEFGRVSYAAEDDIWIVYDEPSASFLQLIGKRDRLDSFTVIAPPLSRESAIKIEAGLIENLVIESEKGLTEATTKVSESTRTGTDEKSVKLVVTTQGSQQ